MSGDDRVEALGVFPLQLGIRLVLDDISYSNALPYWCDTVSINYSTRESVIRRKLAAYLDGVKPEESFGIPVPRKSGAKRVWRIPTVNDQILLQACISSFAERLDREALKRRVFSYRYNRDDNRLALIEDQIAAWARFQDETKLRCAGSDCILQIDLQNAFPSIDRVSLYDFLGNFSSGPVVDLFRILLESFSAGGGLPLINDSLFFVGNAYLSRIDSIVEKYEPQFIRFVDDYRIFSESTERLERSLRGITADLENAGFKINAGKLRLGTGEDYLDVVSTLRNNPKIQENEYVQPAVVRDLMRTEDLATVIAKTLDDPDRYLNEGFGRFQLGVVRKFRFDQSLPGARTDEDSESLSARLSGNSTLVRRFSDLLANYSQDRTEQWRTAWLLYIAKDLDFGMISPKDKELGVNLRAAIERIGSEESADPVVRLWANKNAGSYIGGEDVDKLHDLGYLESGRLHCTGYTNAA